MRQPAKKSQKSPTAAGFTGMSRPLLPDAMTCRQSLPSPVCGRGVGGEGSSHQGTIRSPDRRDPSAPATRSRRDRFWARPRTPSPPSGGGLPYGPQPPVSATLLPPLLACRKRAGKGGEKGDKSNFCDPSLVRAGGRAAEIGLIPFFVRPFPSLRTSRGRLTGPGFHPRTLGHRNSGPLSQRDQTRQPPGQRARVGCRRCASSPLDATSSLTNSRADFKANF